MWRRKYRYAPAGGSLSPESSIGDTWRRVAGAVASVDESLATESSRTFFEILDGFRFLPGGRILASAGTRFDATLFNCFAMGSIEDSMGGIFDGLKESALTMQRGGGIGCDFSTLRPAGSAAAQSGRIASGPVSFMHLWNAMCTTLVSQGNRRGAMMGVLRCDHPDIVDFVDAKRTRGALTNFNLSVQVTDEFVEAVADDREWALLYPAVDAQSGAPSRRVLWPGHSEPVACAVHARVQAAELWQRIVNAAFDTGEPGVLFVDTVNRLNNLYYREHITTTNPCGEIPLPPNGACNLGSINLAALVDAPYSDKARLNLERIGKIARDATRFLDNVIDLSDFPIEAQAAEARATRRIGLGITGLADSLIMLGLRYDSAAGRELARTVVKRVRDEAYGASVALAEEKGSFPCFDREAYLDGEYIGTLPADIRDGIAKHGIRNSHLLAIAPAGSISILANNVSSGIEPVFAARMHRVVLDAKHAQARHETVDHAYTAWVESGNSPASLPPTFVTAHEISPDDHLLMAAAIQPLVDNAMAKTVNVAEEIERAEFNAIYRRAFDLGLKGCTVFRSNPVTGEVISAAADIDGQARRPCADGSCGPLSLPRRPASPA